MFSKKLKDKSQNLAQKFTAILLLMHGQQLSTELMLRVYQQLIIIAEILKIVNDE